MCQPPQATVLPRAAFEHTARGVGTGEGVLVELCVDVGGLLGVADAALRQNEYVVDTQGRSTPVAACGPSVACP